MKDSLYEENYKLHSENARLQKKLDQLDSSLGIDRLRAHFEAEIQKQLRREEKLKKETDRYHRLWPDAVSELRSKGDIIELRIQQEGYLFFSCISCNSMIIPTFLLLLLQHTSQCHQ